MGFILVERVAHAQNLVDKADLPAGTYDTQLTFAQQLMEATKQVANDLLLISVMLSIKEIGAGGGSPTTRCLIRLSRGVRFWKQVKQVQHNYPYPLRLDR